uniref:L,D-transpeptidase family protein n=1 Tax=Falsiroseomonas oryzae TaxID=2766473 RepID=UPI0022EAA6FD
AELARAKDLARRGWGSIPGDATIEPGSTDPVRVPALRARLAAEDPVLAAAPDRGAFYDPALEAGVRRWQQAMGLEVDGRVGRISLGLLNRPPGARVDQLRVALDMRRAAAPEGRDRRIEVNVPDFRLAVLEDGREVLAMAVIVGRRDRQTPMLRVRMTAIQFNPPWGVPERNAREDLLPRLRRDPQAVLDRGFRIFQFVNGERVEVDPRTVDWSQYTNQRFPFVIRQDAGDANALGRIKFIMPNGDDIFMHDTPDRHLFRRPDRAFSSGCIRLERPMDFMAMLLEGSPGWNVERAQRAIDSRVTSAMTLGRSLPVLLRYQTAVVEGGRVRIRPDIYGLDEAYARALNAAPRAQVAAL